MTIYALGNCLGQQDGLDIGLEQDRLRVVRESGAVDIFMQVGFEIVMARHGVLLAAITFDSNLAAYGGVALLVAALVWNLWPKLTPTSGSCPNCDAEEPLSKHRNHNNRKGETYHECKT